MLLTNLCIPPAFVSVVSLRSSFGIVKLLRNDIDCSWDFYLRYPLSRQWYFISEPNGKKLKEKSGRTFLLFSFFVTNRAIDGIDPQLFSFERSKIIFILFFFFSHAPFSHARRIFKIKTPNEWSPLTCYRNSRSLLRIVNLQKKIIIEKRSGRDLIYRKLIRINYKSRFLIVSKNRSIADREIWKLIIEKGREGEGRYKSLILTRAEANSRIDYGQPLSLGLPGFLCFRHVPANARRW